MVCALPPPHWHDAAPTRIMTNLSMVKGDEKSR